MKNASSLLVVLIFLPCGSIVCTMLTRRASGGHTSSAFSGARTVTPISVKIPFYPCI
jgi:hypothetical protein